MNANQFWHHYTHILTGYLSTVGVALRVADAIPHIRQECERSGGGAITYVCDPVLGDNGKLYLPKEFVAAYRQRLVPLADVLLPNQTECEFLSGRRIRTELDA